MSNHQKESNGNGYASGKPATGYTIYLPLNHNNGSRMQPERLNWAFNTIVWYAGGLTKYAPAIGLWVSPSALVMRDRVLPVQIVVPRSRGAEQWFTRFAVELAVRLEQECIFLTAQPLRIVETSGSTSIVSDEN